MAEPATSTSAFIITGVIGALLGPLYGPFVLMFFAALMGGMLAMSRAETSSKLEAVRFLFVAVGVSMVLTGAGVWAIEQWTALPGNIALMPVAFAFAAARNSLLSFIDKILEALISIFQKRSDV